MDFRENRVQITFINDDILQVINSLVIERLVCNTEQLLSKSA